MKSSHNNKTNQNMLISRKKPQTTGVVLLTMFGFISFLTGGLAAATAVIDAVINQVSVMSFVCLTVGIIAYKVGRYIMQRVSE